MVDDFEAWRRFVSSILQNEPGWHIVGEASDGLEAVQRAEELRPDLVLLDIGLPKLNGMEVAKRLRNVAPDTKILFLSINSSPDVVREAHRLGAMGYVHKSRTQGDLLPAIEAILGGKQFVSNNLEGWESESAESTALQTLHRHEMLVCSDETILLENFTRFIVAALTARNSAIVIATKSHLEYLCQTLKAEGIDVDGATQQGTYVSVDVEDMPSTIMVNGWPDLVQRFEAAYKAAKAQHPRVALCGECAGRLWAEGQVDVAIRVEQLCSDLAKTHDMDILCAYPVSGVRGEEDEDAFKSICAEHSAVHSQ